MFKETSFVWSYVSDLLHVTLAVITYSRRQQIQKNALYMRHKCLPVVGGKQ